ncbi:MAG: hypothetical protein VB876_10805 [Pirellulales bacterium]
MNLVGKIFVFLVFCMSLVFMAFSVMIYATHKNWKDEVMREVAPPNGTVGWAKRLRDANNEYEALDNKKKDLDDQLAAERALRRQLVAKLETEKERLRAKEGQTQQELLVQLDLKKQALTSVAAHHSDMQVLKGDTDKLREQIVVALGEIDDQHGKFLVAQEKAHQATGTAGRLGERQKQLVGQVTKFKEVLDNNDINPDDPADGSAPKVDGFVIRVAESQDQLFVEISVGADDGLRQGHEMEIFRGGTYLGRAKIVRTTSDRAVGKVDRRTQKGEIRARDKVETRRALDKI